MRKIFVIILILSFHFGETQNTIDSLQVLLRARSIDEQYVDILNELSFQYILQKPTDALPHINRAISLSDSINYKIGNFRAVTNKGSAYWASGLPDLALKYYLQAKAKVVEDNWVPNASLLNNIGEVFKKKGQYDSAINYYRLGILEAKRAKPIRIPVMLYYNLGEAYLKLNDVDSADKYFRTSFDSARSTNHRRGLSYSYSGFAELAQMENDLERAIFNHQNGIRIRKEIGDKRGVIQSYHQLSSSLFLQGKTKMAKSYLDSALVLSLENKTYDLLSETYHDIADYYKKEGDFKSALEFAGRHYKLNDSLSNHIFVQNMDQVKAALMSEIQSIENELLIENQKNLESENQAKLVLIITLGCLIIMTGVFLYLNLQRKNAIRITASNRRIIETLQMVSQSGSSRSFHDFMKELLEISATTLQADRASFWLFDKKSQTIEVSDHFSVSGKFQTLGTKVSVGFFKDYFNLLHRENILAVTNTNSSELTVEYDKSYIKDFGIKSLLDVEIQSEDTFIGILSFEHTTRTRRWSYSDQRFASSLSNIISSAYLLNENRKLLVELMDKNKQLLDSGFALSHYLREPLSQILGFSSLMLDEKELEHKQIWQYVDEASKRMDEVITRLTIQLAQENKKA